jgi:hypothetical protein
MNKNYNDTIYITHLKWGLRSIQAQFIHPNKEIESQSHRLSLNKVNPIFICQYSFLNA